METLGLIFLVLIGAAVLAVAILFLASLPDLSRYLRVKRM
jgi:hypothetical protein